jgi:hypothetical protein
MLLLWRRQEAQKVWEILSNAYWQCLMYWQNLKNISLRDDTKNHAGVKLMHLKQSYDNFWVACALFHYTDYDGTVVCNFVSDQVGFLVGRPVTLGKLSQKNDFVSEKKLEVLRRRIVIII